MWKLQLPPKVKNCVAWSATYNSNLEEPKGAGESKLPSVWIREETTHHLLSSCTFARECWALTPLSIQGRL